MAESRLPIAARRSSDEHPLAMVPSASRLLATMMRLNTLDFDMTGYSAFLDLEAAGGSLFESAAVVRRGPGTVIETCPGPVTTP